MIVLVAVYPASVEGEDVASIWVDEWQQACCGTPFAIGDRVTWTLRADVDRPWLARVTSPAIAERIRWAEEHHGSAEQTAELTSFTLA